MTDALDHLVRNYLESWNEQELAPRQELILGFLGALSAEAVV